MGAFLDDYAVVGAIVVAAMVLAAAMLGVNAFMRPRVASREKGLTYESGVDPVGEGWAQSTIRYYVYAFLYVIFAVDAVYLFPWATIFAAPGYGATTLVEMFVFIGFLAVGLLYAWRKGVLTWS